ncbi:lipopolysaccharide biosynthesis protein [Shewanella sp. TC10]|uniref:lipopolysaccharide biosynthesis protein n=1 Tax=Shewanella sp. TC10 TaxID=1419739 RepID=UPI001892A21A|nr:oligosaccharide flippase family protein [Shewanella sp. TC10]
MFSKLLSGVAFNIVNVFIQVFVGLFVVRALLSFLGESDFGLWAILIAFVAQVNLLEFGMGSIIGRHVSKKEEYEGERKVIVSNVMLLISLMASMFLLVAISICYVWDVYSGGLKFNTSESVFLIFSLLSISYSLNLISGTLQGYLNAKFKFFQNNVIKASCNILRLVLLLLSIKYELGVLGIALVFVSISIIELLLKLKWSLSSGLKVEFSLALINRLQIKKIMSSGVMFLPMRVNDYFRNNSSILFVGYIINSASSAPLRISGRLMEIYVEISITLNSVLTPYFSKVSDESSTFERQFYISILCSSALSTLIYINLLVVGEMFLQVWLGEVPDKVWSVLKIMAVGFAIANMQGPVNSLLIAKGEYGKCAKLSVMETVTTLVLMLCLVKLYGVLGAACALLISLSLIRGLIQPILVCRLFKYSILSFTRSALLGVFIVCVTLALCYLISMSFRVSQEMEILLFIFLQIIGMLLTFLGYKFKSKK